MITAILSPGFQARVDEKGFYDNLLPYSEVWIEHRNEVQTQFHMKHERHQDKGADPFEFSIVVNNHSQHYDAIIDHMQQRVKEAKERNTTTA